MNKTRNFLWLVLSCLLYAECFGQQTELTLEDMYKNNVYAEKGYGPVKWLADGSGYTTLETNPAGGKDIIKYDPQSGARSILIAAKDLIPPGAASPLIIVDYSWSEDASKLMIFTNTRKVWRYNTRGDFWVFNIASKKLTRLGKTRKATTLQFAKFSPDGRKAAYVSEQNVYVEDLATGKINAVTTSGGGHIINGTSDWAYEEEFDVRDGFRWSSDSKKIAFWQFNTSGIGTFYLINNLDSIYPKLIPLPYPKVGTTVAAAKVGVADIATGKTVWMNIQGDPRDNYLPRMDWAYAPDELIIQQLNRKQNTNRILLANAKDGSIKIAHTEKVDTWLDCQNNITFLQDGKHFTFLSDESGWMHLEKIATDGGKTMPITSGKFEVIELLSIDRAQGYAYYIASPDNPTQRYLFRSPLSGNGNPERLTPRDEPGNHRYQISPDSRYAIHTYSNSESPTIIELISLPDHKSIRILQDNKELKTKLAGLALKPKEFFRVTLHDGLALDGWMIKPKDFDPAKKYPVFFYVYGEPAGTTVEDRWEREYLWHQYIANQGYIVISIDNRGTNVPRGREWRKSIYKQIGIQAPIDQAEAARQIQHWDFVDSTRIGIWGWSGGGSMTLNCMFRYPEIYKTGIAVAFISDQRLYDAIYQERYMSLPDDNEKGYHDGSPINHAKDLQGNLLLIHGSGDDNCHYQSCERLVNELIKDNKYFTMVEYPMRTHSISERENTSLHLRKTISTYLMKNVPPKGVSR